MCNTYNDYSNYSDYQKNQVTVAGTMAYLIGAKTEFFENYVTDAEEFEKLKANENAVIMRALCNIRSNLMLNFSKTDNLMRYDMQNIDRQAIYSEDVAMLYKNGINLVKANYTVNKYLRDINTHIVNRLDKIKGFFPDWVEWAYIKDLFIMPKGTVESSIVSESKKYQQNQGYYPYKRYIHWNPVDKGNILLNDVKFLDIVYRQHNDIFTDKSKVLDASETTKGNIYDFISNAESAVVVVDCENSDAYKIASVLKQLNPEELSKIKKIMLYDDKHTTNAWKYMKAVTNIDVEYEEIKRINEYKSLVDMRMGMGISREFYKNNVDSFIICSSDSDYWAVISELPEADFLVMMEYDKCGGDIKGELAEHGIYYCSIDDFCTGNIASFKNVVLLSELKDRISNLFELNADTLVDNVFTAARIDATEAEKKSFYDKYIKKMTVTIDDNGNMSLKIPD